MFHAKIIELYRCELERYITIENTRILERLVKKQVLSFQDVHNIEDKKLSEQEQVRFILDKVCNMKLDSYKEFREVLREEGQDHIIEEWLPLPPAYPSSSTFGQATIIQKENDKSEDDQIEISGELTGLLRISRKEDAVSEKPKLSATKWRELQDNIMPVIVTGILLESINIGQCLNSISDFLGKCANLIQFCMKNVIDGSPDNKGVSLFIAKSLENLAEVKWLYLFKIYIGYNSGAIFRSFRGPKMVVLDVSQTDFNGCGTELSECLSTMPNLKCLNMMNAGLARDDMDTVIGCLPNSCPHICTIMCGWNEIGQPAQLPFVVSRLPHLRFFSISNCGVPEDIIVSIVDQVPPSVEWLDIHAGAALSVYADEFVSKIEKQTKIRWLWLSEDQLNEEKREKLKGLLRRRGGGIETGCCDDEWSLEFAESFYAARQKFVHEVLEI